MATLLLQSQSRLPACNSHLLRALRACARVHHPHASLKGSSVDRPGNPAQRRHSSQARLLRCALRFDLQVPAVRTGTMTLGSSQIIARARHLTETPYSYSTGPKQTPDGHTTGGQQKGTQAYSSKADDAQKHDPAAGRPESSPSSTSSGQGRTQPDTLSKDTETRQKDDSRLEDSRTPDRLTPGTVTQQVQSSLKKLTSTHENIYNLPNFLTVTRLIAAPTTAYLLLHDYNKAALALFAYAGITDFVDGWLARRWQLRTVAGSVMDPMADKALMIILTATLAAKGAIPLYLATLILGRDASMGIAAIYYRYASLPAPKTFTRYWDFSLPSAEVHPTQISKQNTFLQLILIGSTLALPVLTAENHHLGTMHDLGLDWLNPHIVMTGLQVLVATTTVWSGLSYVTNKSAVKMLSSGEKTERSRLENKRRGSLGRAIIGLTFGAVIILAAYQAYQSWQADLEDKKVKKDTRPATQSQT